MQLTRRFSLNLYLVKDPRVRGTVLHVFRAPSKARLYRLRVSPSSRSFGKALDIECCVGVGHATAKRTQRGGELQCESVKESSPVIGERVTRLLPAAMKLLEPSSCRNFRWTVLLY